MYEKSEGVEVTEEEQREEDEYYRDFPNAPKALWSYGGWMAKKDEDEPPAKKFKSSPEQALPKPSVGEINTIADNPAPGSPLRTSLSKHETGRKPEPAPKTSSMSHQKQIRLSQVLAPAKFRG